MTYSDLKVIRFFEMLSKTSSTLEKKQLLSKYANDAHVKPFLDYLLNPFFVTGISEKKIAKNIQKEPTVIFSSFHELMAYVRENHTGSDEVLSNVQAFLSNTIPELRDFYIGIITKSIRLGCDAKTVNSALGYELIPIWEVQQAYQFNKVKLSENEWFSLSQKLNGIRGTFYEGKIIGRQGKEFSGLDHIINDIYKLVGGIDGWVIDGELIRKNTDSVPDNENFRLTTGIINSEESDKTSIQFVIFDFLSKEEFLKGESKFTYKERRRELQSFNNVIDTLKLDSLKIVDMLYEGTDISKVDFYLQQMVAEDKEGLMLNRDSKYMRKRHNGILKVKQFYTVDLCVVDVEEGSGRLKGTLGAFVVRYRDNILRVGSGMTDEQRHQFWENRESLIDRVIEVKYKEESRDKETGKPSLQFPIFVQLRELGKQESYD